MKPYRTAHTKKEEIRTMFDNIAHRYDRLNELLSLGIHRGWRKKVVGKVEADRPHRILDLATGTADLAIALAEALPEAHITGIDLSEKMLAIGAEKIGRRGLGNRITLQQGEAENIALDPDATDTVTIGFGIRNFEDAPSSLREIYRVLKPRGKVYILEFGMPKNKLVWAGYNFYFRFILPQIGRLISKDKEAYRYLPESVAEFPHGTPFADTMQRCGFINCQFQNLSAGIAQLYVGEKPGK